MTGPRVLVTGASGFLGRHCLARLGAGGGRIHAVASRETPAEPGSAVWHHADLLDGDQVRALVAAVRPTHLLHLAWVTTPGDCYASPSNLSWVRASLELLEAAAAAGTRRVVVTGTCAEYDWSAGRCDEATTPLAPASLYGVAKDALRRLVEGWAPPAGISAAWARLFFLFGPGEHPDRLVPYVARSLLAGRVAECSHGEQLRDYLYVEDAAAGLVRLLTSDVEGPINLAAGREIALKELVAGVARRLGGESLVRLAARPARPDEPPRIAAAIDRQSRELGWAPEIGIEAGLDRTVAWWRARAARDAC